MCSRLTIRHPFVPARIESYIAVSERTRTRRKKEINNSILDYEMNSAFD